MTTERVPMTQEQFNKLKTEIDRMQNIEMIEITKHVAEARGMGDLSENAEYHAAREAQGMLQARIDRAKDRLARAVVVDPTQLPSGTVVFGAKVRVKDLDSGDVEDLILVGPGDEDYENNKILATSPRGKGLMGKKVGDIAEITVPRGTMRYEVLEITNGL
jgi:transcription elongation factor GreA